MEDEVQPLTEIEVLVKVFLRNREEPVLAPTSMLIPANSIIRTPQDVADFCTECLLDDFDQRSARWVILGDATNTRRVFLCEDVHHFVVFPPENLDLGDLDE